jgi:hypothetical protein
MILNLTADQYAWLRRDLCELARCYQKVIRSRGREPTADKRLIMYEDVCIAEAILEKMTPTARRR